MRLPPDTPPRRRVRTRRRGRRIALIAILVVVILLLLSLQGIATFYTDYLWYQSVHLPGVWRVIVETKLELAAVFIALMFALVWASLWFVDRLVPKALLFQPELDLVRRFQTFVGPHVILVRTLVAGVVAFIVGSSAASQWQNWLLFVHAKSFSLNDPVYGRNDGFFVFRLPFETFLVDWLLVALITVFVVTAVFLYLNGAIRFQGTGPRVEPIAVGHLSLILGVIAFVKAAGYWYVQRYSLEFSTRGVVQGANYTDINVQKPALELLAVVAFVVFVMLAFNIYYRSFVLPAVGVGLWALVALGAGFVYPALVQALKVTPAQSSLELPYIKRNIVATRYGMNIGNVGQKPFAATSNPDTSTLSQFASTVNDAVLWDPTIANLSYQKLQAQRSFFQLQGLAIDRYVINKEVTPVVVGARGLYPAGVPSQSWVNTHLEYTHGYGATLSPANVYGFNGVPNFDVSNLPPQSVAGAPKVTTPGVYFGLGSNGYVVVHSDQPEIDYTSPAGNVTSSYQASGGVKLSSLWTRLAFAIRFHDLNLLISKLVNSDSQIVFVQNVRSMVQKAAPFLQVDANPYPVIDNGQIDWIVDCYTTSDYLPYGQNADTAILPSGSGLAGTYNYVRNSVKAVVNAYTGAIQFYVVDPSDPLIQAWEAAFPGMWQPLSAMDSVLQQHLRYPQDLLMVQSAAYGRYHLTDPAAFYNAASAYEVAQTAGTGSPSAPLPTLPDGSIARYTPTYELLQLNGPTTPQFDLVEPFVPYSSGDRLQTLSGFMIAGCDQSDYGQLTFYTSGSSDVNGPALVNSEINGNSAVSRQISLLDQHGSTVTLGTTLLLPIDGSLVWVRSLYLSPSQNAFPELQDVIVVEGNQVAMGPDLYSAIQAANGSPVPGVGVNQTGQSISSIPQQVAGLISEAHTDAKLAAAALSSGDLALYQQYQNDVATFIAEAESLLQAESAKAGTGTGGSGTGGSGGGTSTTTLPAAPTTTTVPTSTTSTTSTSSTTPTTSTSGNSTKLTTTIAST